MQAKILTILLVFQINLLGGILPTTLIKTPNSFCQIQHLRYQDQIVGFDGQEITQSKIKQITPKDYSEIIQIKLPHATIITSLNQKFYVLQAADWVAAEDLLPGDLIETSLDPIEIIDTDYLNQPTRLFSLSLEYPHTFFISKSEILVHNEPLTLSYIAATATYPAIEYAAAAISCSLLTWLGYQTIKFNSSDYKYQKHPSGISHALAAITIPTVAVQNPSQAKNSSNSTANSSTKIQQESNQQARRIKQCANKLLKQPALLSNPNRKTFTKEIKSLIRLNVEDCFRQMLKVNSDNELWPLINHPNGLLKIFNQPFVANYQPPTNLTYTELNQCVKRLNELMFYNQNTQLDQATFQAAAQIITAGLHDNLNLAHLAYGSISPVFINDFLDEANLILAHAQQQPEKSNLPQLPDQQPEELQDPKDPQHRAEVLTALAAANEKSEELIVALNEKIKFIEKIKDIVIRSVNLRHIFHGDLAKNGTPTGCHHAMGRCCFRFQKMFTGGKKVLFDVVKIVKNGLDKTSSIMPWKDAAECMDKAIETVKNGEFCRLKYDGSAVNITFKNLLNGIEMTFRINKNSIESFFLQIGSNQGQ